MVQRNKFIFIKQPELWLVPVSKSYYWLNTVNTHDPAFNTAVK